MNGVTSGISGRMPTGSDSTLSRQTVRSGFPRLSELTFPSSMLRAGANTVTFTRPSAAGSSNSTGMGWDTVLLEIDTAARIEPAVLTVAITSIAGPTSTNSSSNRGASEWRVDVTNNGDGDARCARLDTVTVPTVIGGGGGVGGVVLTAGASVNGMSLRRFAVPLGDILAGTTVSAVLSLTPDAAAAVVRAGEMGVMVSANGGEVRAVGKAAMELRLA